MTKLTRIYRRNTKQSPYQYMQIATTVYKPAHETTETTNNGKVTGTIRASCLMYADEHTKVFMNN